jgi:hypothetical protein
MFGFFRKRATPRTPAADLLRAAAEAEPERPDEVQLLRACRERFGAPPRQLAAADARACRLTLTPDVDQLFRRDRDPLLRILADQHVLRDRGQVYWGHLVQANQMLFDPQNPHTLPANVIYSTDPFFDGRVAILASIGHGLFAQKGSSGADPELRAFVRAITNERERILRRELPAGYCGNRPVYFTTCFIQPGHLPDHCVARPAFPLLVNFEETEAVMILPSRFWPPELVSSWRG